MPCGHLFIFPIFPHKDIYFQKKSRPPCILGGYVHVISPELFHWLHFACVKYHHRYTLPPRLWFTRYNIRLTLTVLVGCIKQLCQCIGVFACSIVPCCPPCSYYLTTRTLLSEGQRSERGAGSYIMKVGWGGHIITELLTYYTDHNHQVNYWRITPPIITRWTTDVLHRP